MAPPALSADWAPGALTVVTHSMVVDVRKGQPTSCQYSSWFRHPQSSDALWWRVQCEVYGDLSDSEQFLRVELRGKPGPEPAPASTDPLGRFFLCAAVARICQEDVDGCRDSWDVSLSGQGPVWQGAGAPGRPGLQAAVALRPEPGGPRTGPRSLLPNLRHASVIVWIAQLRDPALEQYLCPAPCAAPAPAPPLFCGQPPARSPAASALWDTRKFADVALSVEDGQELAAHKLILVASSPFFEAMFEHDMLESRLNRVELPDVSAAVMTEALRFMYCGEADTSRPDLAKELLALSERYLLHGLRPLCEQALVAHVLGDRSGHGVVVNSCVGPAELELARDLLSLCALHQLPRLQAACELVLGSHMAGREVELLELSEQRAAPGLRRLLLARLAALPGPHNLKTCPGPAWAHTLLADDIFARELLLAKMGVNEAAGVVKRDS